MKCWFESVVVPDGGKTSRKPGWTTPQFESVVVPDSGKTRASLGLALVLLENVVVSDRGKITQASFFDAI